MRYSLMGEQGEATVVSNTISLEVSASGTTRVPLPVFRLEPRPAPIVFASLLGVIGLGLSVYGSYALAVVQPASGWGGLGSALGYTLGGLSLGLGAGAAGGSVALFYAGLRPKIDLPQPRAPFADVY